ncbi:hypothetical protein BC826DRAFT_721693 [Russula brevipes]|nr:hypothetical protein BC826DRAFT_721693 [Russula brevipes]
MADSSSSSTHRCRPRRVPDLDCRTRTPIPLLPLLLSHSSISSRRDAPEKSELASPGLGRALGRAYSWSIACCLHLSGSTRMAMTTPQSFLLRQKSSLHLLYDPPSDFLDMHFLRPVDSGERILCSRVVIRFEPYLCSRRVTLAIQGTEVFEAIGEGLEPEGWECHPTLFFRYDVSLIR